MLLETGLWSLEQSYRQFIAESEVTPPARTCYYHEWQDVTAAEFRAHIAAETEKWGKVIKLAGVKPE